MITYCGECGLDYKEKKEKAPPLMEWLAAQGPPDRPVKKTPEIAKRKTR